MAIRLPFSKYLHTNSAVCSHATTGIQSTRSFPLASLRPREQAIVNEATLFPVVVCRSSGSRESRPIIAITLSIFCPFCREIIRPELSYKALDRVAGLVEVLLLAELVL